MTPRDQYGEGVVIVGLDISSVRLDACLLVPGQPPVLRHEVLGKSSEPQIERVRRVPEALMHLCAFMPDIDWVAIEWPIGRFANVTDALLPIVGAITCSVPSETQITWRKASEWRTDLGAANTKPDGARAAFARLSHDRPGQRIDSYSEHELDAAGIAYAWALVLEAQAAA